MTEIKKARTEGIVKNEIEQLELEAKRKIASLREAARKSEMHARIHCTTKVGEIARTWTEPETKAAQVTRDRAKFNAKMALEAALSKAHGEYQKALKEIDERHAAARTAIDKAASNAIQPFEQAYEERKATLNSDLQVKEAEIAEAFVEATRGLRDELAKMEAARKAREKATMSEVALAQS